MCKLKRFLKKANDNLLFNRANFPKSVKVHFSVIQQLTVKHMSDSNTHNHKELNFDSGPSEKLEKRGKSLLVFDLMITLLENVNFP